MTVGVNDLLANELVEDLLGGALWVRSSGGDVGDEVVALEELVVGHAVRETHAGDTDTLEHTVTGELVEDNGIVNLSGHLLVVGDDAADEVGVGGTEGVEEVVELLTVLRGDSDLGVRRGRDWVIQ